MDPSGNSKLFQNMETTASSYHHQQGTSECSVLQQLLSNSPSENAVSTKRSSPGIASVSPVVSENFRQLPFGTETTAHSFLHNSSSNVTATVELGFPNVPLVTGPSSLSSFSNLSNPLAQNSQRQMLEMLQSANLLPQMSSQFPSFPIQPAAPFQGLPSTNTLAQLPPVMSTPLLAAFMQQMLCRSLSANATPMALPMNNSNLMTQMMAQLFTAQLAQSTQADPLGVFLQFIQACSSTAGSPPVAAPLQPVAPTSILSQLLSLDPATAKQVIVILVNQLIQSGNLTGDDICQRFLGKLQSSTSSSPWSQTQQAASSSLQTNLSLQNLPITLGSIKKEIITSADGDYSDGFTISVSTNASSLHRSAFDGAAGTPVSDAIPSNFASRVSTASKQSDIERSSGRSDGETIGCKTKQRTKANDSHRNSKNTAKRTAKSSVEQLSKISMKDEYATTDSSLDAVDKGTSKTNLKDRDKIDLSQRTEPSEEFQTSGKRLRNRSKTVNYYEEECTDGLEHNDTDVRPKKKKLNSQAHSDYNTTVEGTQTIASISCSPTASSSTLADVASCKSGTDSQVVSKNEITGPICVLPMVNSCHSPNVRYLFMGRKDDGMDWLNLVSYKTKDSDDAVNQCLFCPMTCSDVKPVADHIASEHGDLDFVLRNIKQPNANRVTYLACRHCNFVTFEPTLMWIHFELYHGIPGIMDGSSLPQAKISDTVTIEEISLDKPVNSKGCQPAYVCLDCMLCSNNSKNVAMHVLQAHPDTVNFNGCFVKLMMIKTKEIDSFTFREALYDDSHADALKDAYVCMLCQYSTYSAYLAMSHSLRLHQTKRLLFICDECEYQCTQESLLTVHRSSTHQCSSISSFMFSVTLIATSSDGAFTECKIPTKRQKISDNRNNGSDCEMKSTSIIQSTAVSSSQEKRKSRMLTGREDSTVLPNLAVMPHLEPEVKSREENLKTGTSASEKAPMLKPVRHS